MDLRHDQAPFGRLLVDGHDKHRHLARAHQVAENNGRADKFLGGRAQQRLAEVENTLPPVGGSVHAWHLHLVEPGGEFGVRAGEVYLVEDNDDRRPALTQLIEQLLLECSPCAGLGHEHAEVGAVDDLARALNAHFAKGAHIVDAGRVDEEHRPERQQFHGFFHGVGGRAGEVRDNGHLLPSDGVQQTRFSHIAAAEDAEKQSK